MSVRSWKPVPDMGQRPGPVGWTTPWLEALHSMRSDGTVVHDEALGAEEVDTISLFNGVGWIHQYATVRVDDFE